jgi:hypothetical protein
MECTADPDVGDLLEREHGSKFIKANDREAEFPVPAPGNSRQAVFRSGFTITATVEHPEWLHMDEGDLREQILRLEARIDELAKSVESCRKMILISKAVIGLGGILLLVIVLGAIRFDPMAVIGGIAAIVGGAVVFGSNKSTSEQATTAMKAAEAQRAELIGRIGLPVVGNGNL